MLCRLCKVFRRADTICFSNPNNCCFFGGWVALLWLFPSAKCWRALKCHTTTVLWVQHLFVCSENQVWICSGEQKIHLRLVGTIQPVHTTVNACRHIVRNSGMSRKGKKRWDTLLSGELTDVRVAALHLWLCWDPSFCLSHAQPKTYDPYCCFSLSIRQAL